MNKSKNCSICFLVKPVGDFYSRMKTNKKNEKYIYYNPECKECTKSKSVKWRRNNPERYKKSVKKINARSDIAENKRMLSRKNRLNGKVSEWQKKNKDKMQEYSKRSQNKKHEISKKEWLLCKEYFNNSCAYCGLHISEHFNNYKRELKWTDFHKEHVNHEGANDITNCVPSCKICNSEKHTSLFEDWYVDGRRGYTEERKNKILQWINEDFKLVS